MLKNLYVKIINIILAIFVFVTCGSSAYTKTLSDVLIERKQAIYNSVYFIGTATNLKVLSEEDGFIKVEIDWRGPINEETSIIGIEYDNNNVRCYEIAIRYSTNQDNIQKARGIGVAATAVAAVTGAFVGLLKAIEYANNPNK